MKSKLKMIMSALISLVILALLPTLTQSGYVLTLLFGVFLYMTLSQSWNILGGYAGQVNVGSAVIFGMGSLVTRFLWLDGMPFLLAFLIGGIATLILGLLIGSVTFFLKGPYFSIATLAVAMIARITIGNIFPRATSLTTELLRNYNITNCYYLALVTASVTFLVIYLVVNSKLGLGMKAIREDEDEASAIGINPFKTKMASLMVSSFFGGLAGGMYAFFYASFYWHTPFELLWCFEPILITFIGGAGTIIGPVIGSVFFVAMQEIFILTAGEAGTLIFGAAFILVVLFLPKGLIGLVSKS
jgi:branched-chain amino acid transport system permease protein